LPGFFRHVLSVNRNPMQISSTGGSGAAPAGTLARIATAVFFFVFGFMVASWIAHIPTIKNRLGISSGQLGMALLGIAIGSLISMYLIGMLTQRWGSRRLMVTGSLLGSALMGMPVLMPDYRLLLACFMALGIANGCWVVAMNAQAIAVERRMRRFIMSSLHAMYSIGGLAGSLFALLLLSAGVSPEAHSLTAAALALLLALGVKRFLLPDRLESEHHSGKGHFSARGGLILLGMLTFVTLMTEGAVADWSALYLHQQIGLKSEMASLGYAGFSLAMAVGRLAGDGLVLRFGRAMLLQTGGALAALGFAMVVMFDHYLTAVSGFVCVGLGVSNVIPLLYGAAGNMKNVQPGIGIATVSALGHLGFLIGPPAIGFLADWTGLAFALGIFILFMALVALMGKWVENQTSR
jgi:MFS family permease